MLQSASQGHISRASEVVIKTIKTELHKRSEIKYAIIFCSSVCPVFKVLQR